MERQNARGGTNDWRRTSFALSVAEGLLQFLINEGLFLKNSCATQLYKYSRSEIFRLGRWNIDSSSGLHLDDEEIQDATTIATLCVVLLAGKFLAGQGHSADCQQIETLAADYATRAS